MGNQHNFIILPITIISWGTYTIDNGLLSIINLNEFRPFTMIFHARCKHDCTGRPSSSDQVLPSTEPTMYPHLSFRMRYPFDSTQPVADHLKVVLTYEEKFFTKNVKKDKGKEC